jgi:hypothetical protein
MRNLLVVAHQDDDPYVPWTSEDVVGLRRNLRRTRPVICLLLVGVASLLHFAEHLALLWTTIYLLISIPAACWFVTRFVNQMIARGNG